MMLIPVESKQIAYVSYDEDNGSLSVHMHTGEVTRYPNVSKQRFDCFVAAPNPYDALVQLTSAASNEEDPPYAVMDTDIDSLL